MYSSYHSNLFKLESGSKISKKFKIKVNLGHVSLKIFSEKFDQIAISCRFGHIYWRKP